MLHLELSVLTLHMPVLSLGVVLQINSERQIAIFPVRLK